MQQKTNIREAQLIRRCVCFYFITFLFHLLILYNKFIRNKRKIFHFLLFSGPPADEIGKRQEFRFYISGSLFPGKHFFHHLYNLFEFFRFNRRKAIENRTVDIQHSDDFSLMMNRNHNL